MKFKKAGTSQFLILEIETWNLQGWFQFRTDLIDFRIVYDSYSKPILHVTTNVFKNGLMIEMIISLIHSLIGN